MWKWFLILWFAHWRTLTSQPVISENTRETRQLNFEECCPCNSGNGDHDVFGTTMEQAATGNGYSCISAPDSESASSIFTPALRALEPFGRSSKEKQPKPLLKPEVGLASSVLETLREVTDQEYQEALARDAARNALRDEEEDLFEQETIDTPRHIVNIILQPKEGLTEDAMPEASHVQETRCIHPPLGKSTNSFKQKKFKSANKPLRQYFTLPTPTRGIKYYDMDNSPSNMQEQVIPPSQTNVLEDLKSKSNLLKMKLFSSSKNSLKHGYTDTNTNIPNQFNRQADCDPISVTSRVPNFKLGSILDLLKASKQKNMLSSPTITKDKNQENDYTFSPSHLEKYYIRNNGRSYNAHDNVKPSFFQAEKERQMPNQMPYAKEIDTNNKNLEREKYTIVDQSETKSIPFTGTKLKNDNKVIIQNDEMNSDVNHFEGLKNFIKSNSNENIDAMPSPSELNIVEKSIGEKILSENNFNKECEITSNPSITVNKDENNDTPKQTLVEEVIPNTFDKSMKNENDEIIPLNVEVKELENNETNTQSVEVKDHKNISDKESLCDVNDLEMGSSNDRVYKANLSKYENNDGQKSDLNYAANLENIDEDPEIPSLSTPTDIRIQESNKMRSDISTQDLQEMSDRILNLSLSNSKVVEPIVLESKSIVNKNTDIIGKNDDPIKTSKLKNIETSTISSLQTVEPTPTISENSFGNNDEIVNAVDEIADKVDKNNIDIVDSLSTKNPCENIVTKNSEQTELGMLNNREREMMSEASSPIVNRVPHSNQNIVVQPNTNNNNKEFLNNFKSSISDIFNNNRDRNRNAQNENEYDNPYVNSRFMKNNQKSNLNEEPFNELNIDTIKPFSKGFTESNLFKPNKNNNLNSYKAKVATPESLDIRAIPTFRNGKEERLQKTLKNNPEVTSASNVVRNSLDKPNFSRLQNFRDVTQNDYNPKFNLQPHLKSFSENLKSKTEETFRNIEDTFNSLQQSPTRNQNNILESFTKPNMFRTSQPNDISNRLQDFNSDIMDRLSQMSQRIQGGYKTKNNQNDLNNRLKTSPKLKEQLEDNVLLKSKQTSNLKHIQNPISSSKSGIPKQSLQQKSATSLYPMSANLRNTEYASKLRNVFEPKTPPKKDIKRKPLKENKVTFSFTTTTIRPELKKLGSKLKLTNKPTTSTLKSSNNLPKSSTSLKSPLERRIELLSKLKSMEPKPLASNRFTSRIALPDRELDKILTSSSLEESTLIQQNVEIPKSVFSMENDPVVYGQNNVGLSKMRDAFQTKSNGYINKKLTENGTSALKSSSMADATQAASNNINTAVSSTSEKPLKENVSYKCKMVCYEDTDSKK